MPVHKVKDGYRWGTRGKIYPTKEEAERQGRAAYASGYRGRKASGLRKATRRFRVGRRPGK